MSEIFIMVHNDDVPALYTRGRPASPQLARLAEDGDAEPLVTQYENMDGVFSAIAFDEGAPYNLGEELVIPVEVPEGYRVTIATMAIQTNDCFVSINGMELYDGQVLDLPGLDAGSEINNEKCNSIPGPACNSNSTDNNEDGMGEGYVHVHRGFFGIGGTLSEAGYDWRNPMVRVVVSEDNYEIPDRLTWIVCMKNKVMNSFIEKTRRSQCGMRSQNTLSVKTK